MLQPGARRCTGRWPRGRPSDWSRLGVPPVASLQSAPATRFVPESAHAPAPSRGSPATACAVHAADGSVPVHHPGRHHNSSGATLFGFTGSACRDCDPCFWPWPADSSPHLPALQLVPLIPAQLTVPRAHSSPPIPLDHRCCTSFLSAPGYQLQRKNRTCPRNQTPEKGSEPLNDHCTPNCKTAANQQTKTIKNSTKARLNVPLQTNLGKQFILDTSKI